MSLEKKIPYSTVSKFWINFTCHLIVGSHVEKVAHTVKSRNSGHLRVLKNLSVIERCPLMEGNLKWIVTFGTKCFVSYSWHVHNWEVSLY